MEVYFTVRNDFAKDMRASGDRIGGKKMLICDYAVERIDGDYAYLKRTDLPEEECKLVARALLPEEIMEGSRLHYEMMQYTVTG